MLARMGSAVPHVVAPYGIHVLAEEVCGIDVRAHDRDVFLPSGHLSSTYYAPPQQRGTPRAEDLLCCIHHRLADISPNVVHEALKPATPHALYRVAEHLGARISALRSAAADSQLHLPTLLRAQVTRASVHARVAVLLPPR